jgi:hypothetical protein
MPQTSRWWAEWLNAEIADVHVCSRNNDEDVGVVFHPSGGQKPGWYLAITWRATEEDVATGKAPEANGILSATELLINYCPFCGAQLQAPDA